jgi:hypothetical protein
MFFDFQGELDAQSPSGFAGNRFALLPPGGVLPAGANWKAFLGPLAPSFATPIDASLWSRLLRDSFTREPVAIPAANAQSFGDPSFAALKVYKVPERAELLFARSPLGRLRIFSSPQMEGNMLVLAVRDANGVIRQSELPESTTWPVIVDDLPGGTAKVWFLAPMARIFEGDFSGGEAGALGAGQAAAKTTRKKTSAKAKKAGAKADAPEIIAAEQIKIEGVRGQFTSDLGGDFFGQRGFAPQMSVNIVNGRTTDVEIPSEVFQPQVPDL